LNKKLEHGLTDMGLGMLMATGTWWSAEKNATTSQWPPLSQNMQKKSIDLTTLHKYDIISTLSKYCTDTPYFKKTGGLYKTSR